MENFYKNSLEKIRSFYTEKIDETNIQPKLFEILKSIIPFESAVIYYLNGEKRDEIYTYNKNNDGNISAEEALCVNTTPFGVIQIRRTKEFSEAELLVFKSCASIIAAIVKDIEMHSIIKMQLEMLQEGLQKTSTENLKIRAEEQTKNKFIANVSHELRSPLNSIMGFAELLHTQFMGELNEKQLEYVDDIRIASLHLLNMVNEILDMSKIESGAIKLNPREFDFCQNAEEVLNILKPLYIKKGLRIVKNIPQNIFLTADYQKIQQILFNLLSNAIKFTPENGEITISAKKCAKNFTISVKDNGCGIDKKLHKKVFEKFEQAAETANSTGLGLTITWELVKLHNGKITLKSSEGSGAEFIIQLPLI